MKPLRPVCLFVGVSTLDIIHLVDGVPLRNEKMQSLSQLVVAGGCAANSAVVFSVLGGDARLLSPIGLSSIGKIVIDEISSHGVQVVDASAFPENEPCVASILVHRASGDRSIISTKGSNIRCLENIAPVISDVDLVFFDGYFPEIGLPVLREARTQGIPTVMDCGSWKQNDAEVLQFIDHAVCSSVYFPPDCETQDSVIQYLFSLGVSSVVITDGPNPVRWWTKFATGSVVVPSVDVVDTLCAGDIFHGAFSFFFLSVVNNLSRVIALSSKVASNSTRFFGTRAWIVNQNV